MMQCRLFAFPYVIDVGAVRVVDEAAGRLQSSCSYGWWKVHVHAYMHTCRSWNYRPVRVSAPSWLFAPARDCKWRCKTTPSCLLCMAPWVPVRACSGRLREGRCRCRARSVRSKPCMGKQLGDDPCCADAGGSSRRLDSMREAGYRRHARWCRAPIDRIVVDA